MKKANQIQKEGGQVIKQQLLAVLTLTGALTLTACGGGANNTQNPNTAGTTTSSYSGPAPASADVQNFKNNLWNNIHDSMHCGNCHDAGGQGGVDFANNSDINAAYSAAYTVVNLSDPASSKMVTKFSSGGHVCWLGTDAQSQNACASALTSWITNWANASSGAGSTTTIKLVAPTIHAPAPAITMPTTMPANYATGNGGINIYTLVSTNCSGCHVPQPTLNDTPVSPEFAITQAMEPAGGNAQQDSYNVVTSVPLIDPANPTNSRLYTRLAIDGHNCFGTSCTDAANQMLSAINWLLQDSSIPAPSMDTLNAEVTSGAVNLINDGIVASSGGRFEANQIAMYTFMLGSGNLILDRSGISPSMDLTLNGTEGTDYQWLPNWGVQFNTKTAKAQASTTTSQKLATMIGATGEYSIEAWVVPANVTQTNANIVSYSGGSTVRNVTLGQNAAEYEMFNRSSSPATNANGEPVLDTTGSQLLATLQHIVVTYDPTNGRKIYINGILDSTDTDSVPTGTLSNWDTGYALVLGNEVDTKRPWQGAIRMLAIHDRALTGSQVLQNFNAGVGQNYYLLFNVSQNLPNMGCTGSNGEQYCFIVMQAAVNDQSSYLLTNPRFIDLNDATANFTSSLLIKGMRIGINGVEVSTGQAYQDIDVCVNGGCGDANEVDVNYTPGTGVPLSNIGTVIAMQNGPKGSGSTPGDMIFLTFEQLGTVVTKTTYDAPISYTSTPPAASPPAGGDNVMIHTFEEINASLAAITGVLSTNAAINFDTNNPVDCGVSASLPCSGSLGTYTSIIQAMPSSHDASTFVPANQMAVTQLAISYCDQLVSGKGSISPSLYFPAVGFTGSTPPSSLDFTNASVRSAVIDPLLEHVMNVDYSSTPATELSIMPAESTVHAYLDSLIDNGTTGLDASCTTNCNAAQTSTIIKATCAAAIAGAPMLLK